MVNLYSAGAGAELKKLSCLTTSRRSRNTLNLFNSTADNLYRKTFSGSRSFHLKPKWISGSKTGRESSQRMPADIR